MKIMKIRLLTGSLFEVIGIAAVLILTACSSSSTSTTSIPPTSSAAAPPASTGTPATSTTAAPPANSNTPAAVTVDLVAQNFAFSTSTITVPAGAQVTVNFDNKDSGIGHDFSVYTDSSATTTIFKGQEVVGPGTKTFIFTAPEKPGTYYFRCDFHPAEMYGKFIVQ